MSHEFKDVLRFLGIKHSPTTAGNPRSNGMDERQHKIIKNALRASPDKNWVSQLPMLLLSMRNAVKEPINTSSAFLTFGQELRFPGELVQVDSTPNNNVTPTEMVKRLIDVFAQVKPTKSKRANKPVYVPQRLEQAKFVYKQIPIRQNCLAPLYEGPFEVVEKNDKNWTIRKGNGTDTIAKDRLIPAMLSAIDNDETSASTTALPSPTSALPSPTSTSTTAISPEATTSGTKMLRRLRHQPKKVVRFIHEQ